MKDLLYTVAKDQAGNLIKANDALKGQPFYCVTCNGELILRKSERRLKRPHYAHKHLTTDCTPESALHFSFKSLLCQRISEHLRKGIPLEIEWNCSSCFETHRGNLLKRVVTAVLEHNLGNCIPDIALLDTNHNPVAVIEVVVSHPPEDSALNLYRENHVVLIQCKLSSVEDLSIIDNSPLSPTSVDICFNPKCEKCGSYKLKKFLYVIDSECWKCHSPLKVAITGTNQMMIGGLDVFEDNEIDLARRKGVLIQKKYSKTMETSYLASSCSRCDSFAGDHHLFIDYYVPALEDRLPKEVFQVGYYCMNCFEKSEREY